MDKELLLKAEIQAFIKAHEKDDLPTLIMQKKYAHLPLREIAEQIKGRLKAGKKLPSWYKTDRILYPPSVSVEQSSSEVTAKYKAGLVNGTSALDLTGGFGVDSYYLAKTFASHTYVEENKALADLVQHNFGQLQQNNITVYAGPASAFLAANKQHFDLIYIDPDRRPGHKRVTGFEESKPDILQLLPQLFVQSRAILIKASPMLDISLALEQLKKVSMVVVLAVENDVKELLFLLKNNRGSPVRIRTVNIKREGKQLFEYTLYDVRQENCKHSHPLKYLYEPNAAIMKSGGYDLLCGEFDLQKLARNTHLYTADNWLADFPGRCFKVKGYVPYTKQAVLPLLASNKANISTRNFPDRPEQVKKKLGLKDGGQQYLFGYRDMHNKPKVVICEKY